MKRVKNDATRIAHVVLHLLFLRRGQFRTWAGLKRPDHIAMMCRSYAQKVFCTHHHEQRRPHPAFTLEYGTPKAGRSRRYRLEGCVGTAKLPDREGVIRQPDYREGMAI